MTKPPVPKEEIAMVREAMDDRALLEAAAKAAGLTVQRSRLHDPIHRDFLMNGEGVRNSGQNAYPWNPLTDDGDALRLAVKLRLNITFTTELGRGHRNEFMQVVPRSHGHLAEFGPLGDDPQGTIRRAIVRAAAASLGADRGEKP